jgi:hypothetical protein
MKLATTVFSLTGQVSGRIKSGDSAVFSIRFHPKTYGTWTDALRVVSGHDVYSASLVASCPYPMVTMPASIMDWGNVKKGSTLNKPIVIKNISVNTLRIDSIKTSLPQFTVEKSAYPIILSGKDSAIIVVMFKPDTVKNFQGALCVFGNTKDSIFYASITGTGDLATGVERSDLVPTVFGLMQNFPNPFNPTTTLQYGLPMNSRVRLRIFNILGQQVAELVDADQTAGTYRVTWKADVASGMYFYRIEAISLSEQNHRFVDVKRMILMR